ncbi:hypothetical protein [Pseudomonas asiatica]|uniref:hypothetical protein n=1 Tax=Pseudomonas asiatica TaxID=2219225 RepID=UPI0032EC834F
MPTPWEKEEFSQSLEWRKKAQEGALDPISCVSVWMDICGFGSKLESANWDLKLLQKSGIVNLLNEVYQRVGHPFWVGVPPEPFENVLVINDGIARTVDLGAPEYIRAIQAVFYMRDLVLGHLSLLRLTDRYSMGVRTVLAGGERIQYSPALFTGNSILFHSDTPSEYGKKLLETNFLYNPAEFQMNTAFAKAYSIDSKGTSSGFNVNGFYLEKNFLDKFRDVKGLGFVPSDKSILMNHQGQPALELYIKNIIPFQFKGISTDVYEVSSVRVDSSFEGEETLIDLINYETA